MLTKQDIQKIIEANKTVFMTREESEVKFEAMTEAFSDLQTSVDAYAKRADAYFQEMVALTHRIDRLENWAQKISNKLGVQLEF